MPPLIQDLERELRYKQLHIAALLEITQAINNNRNATELFRIYEFILRAQMGFDKILLYHLDQTWAEVLHRNVDATLMQSIDVARDLVPHRNVSECSSLTAKALQSFQYLIPVVHKDHPLAFLLLGSLRNEPAPLNKDQIGFLQTLTNIVVVAIENKRLFKQQLQQESFKKELEVAEQVQAMLIPNRLPNNAQVSMAAIYKPHHNVGGDYYDYIPLNQDEFLLCMADVTGKGIGAALLMSNVQASVRALARESSELTYLVKRLNRLLYDLTGGDRFVTFFVAKYNTNTHQLSYVNAGHNPPILSSPTQQINLTQGTTLLGVFKKLPPIEENTLLIAPNTQLLIYTDGLTDVENEQQEFFGYERIEAFAKQQQHLPLDLFKANFLQQIQQFKGQGNYTDDVSVLICRFLS